MQIKFDHLFVKEEQPYEKVMPMLMDEADLIQNNQKDYKASNVRLSEDNMLIFKDGSTKCQKDITEFAFGQFCSKIGMPISFYGKLMNSEPAELQDMAIRNINTLARYHKNKLLLRCNEDVVRGVLSTKYMPFDTDKILNIFDDEMKNNGLLKPDDLMVRGFVNNPDIFHLRLTSATPIKAEGVEDGIYTGLSIDTSNVGKAKIAVNFFIYRKLCSNGMVVSYFNKNLFSQKHMNISESEISEGLQYSFKIFPQIALKAEEMIIKASNTNIAKELMEFSEKDFRKETIKNKLNASDKDMEEITHILRDNYPATVWGYTNAITEFSKTKEFERRIELERLAGDILYNPNRYALVA